MSRDDFIRRTQRLEAAGPPKKSAKSKSRPAYSMKSLVYGVLTSGIIVVLFYNLQTISDMAPQSVKDSNAPGLFGLPIAVITAIWVAGIPIVFVINAAINCMRSGGPKMPNPFILGAFLALALGMLIIRAMMPELPQ